MANSHAMGKTTVHVEGRELMITRRFQAPRELVFKAWTDPKHLPNWWGPQGFTVTTQDMDVRPGGVWRYVMHGPDGTDYDNKITFLEIEHPVRLAYLHGDGDADERFRVSVTFEQEGQGTLLTMRMVFQTAEELEMTVKQYGAIEGAQQTMERLDHQLPKISLVTVKGQLFVLERIFNAPKDLVFKAFSESEHLKRWFGPRGWDLPVSNLDFRPGGSWHYCMKCVDKNQGDFYGFESWGKSFYQEIIENEKIVYTDYFSDAEGNLSTEMPVCEVTLTFVEQDGKTLITSTAKYPTEEALQKVVDMGMEQGITETWDRLAEHLEALQ